MCKDLKEASSVFLISLLVSVPLLCVVTRVAEKSGKNNEEVKRKEATLSCSFFFILI